MNDLPHVARSSGKVEWYTPEWILAGVRAVLGEIDLDPASCEEGQSRVQARTYFTVENDGLLLPWYGRVFMNPPYARGLVDRFAVKFAAEWLIGHITEGLVLVNNATETSWFQTLAVGVTAVCTLRGRVAFHGPGTEGRNKGLQGQALLYYGPNAGLFKSVWEPYGQVYLAVGDGLRRGDEEMIDGIYYAMEEALDMVMPET